MSVKVNVEWSWSKNGDWIKIHTVAHASNGWKATTDRLYRKKAEHNHLTDMELAVKQAELAVEDVKGRFGAENKPGLAAGFTSIEKGKNAIHSSSETSSSTS